MRQPSITVVRTPDGDLEMSVRISADEIRAVGEMVFAQHLSDIMDRCVVVLRDIVVERVQADVLAKIDLPTIVNLTNIRAGVKLGDRLAEESTRK